MAELLSFASPKESSQRTDYFLCLNLACRRPHFSLLRQRKVSKRKASQRPWPYGLPCATRVARGRAQTRYAQTSARPDPVAAALLSTAYGLRSPNTACARSLRLHCTRLLARCARQRGCSCHSKHTTASPTAAAAPNTHPFTTTATLTNLSEPTRIATFRVNTPIRPKKNKLGIQAPLHPPRG